MKYIVYYHDELEQEHNKIYETKEKMSPKEKYKIQTENGEYYIDKWVEIDETEELLIF